MRQLWVMVVVEAGLGLAQAYAQLPPAALLTGNTWLQKNCSVGEQDQLSEILRKFKPQFEEFFLNALNNGPPASLIAPVEAAAAKTFDARQAALKSGKGLGLSEAELQALRKVTKEEYVARERENFALDYRSRAVAGLGVVSGDRGRAVLKALAADPSSPLQGMAQEILQPVRAAPGRANAKK